MIVPMQKVTLIMPAADRFRAVNELRDLGLMHVEELDLPDESGRTNLEARLNDAARFCGMLELLKTKHPHKTPERTGEALFEAVRTAFAEQNRIGQELEQNRNWRTEMLQWGEFNPAQLASLRERGVYVYLCVSTPAELERLRAAGFSCRELPSSQGKKRRFAVVTDHEATEEEAIPAVKLPTDQPLTVVENKIRELNAARAQNLLELQRLAAALPQLERFRAELEQELEFAVVRDSVGDFGALATLTGFVPEPDYQTILTFAQNQGWGVYARTADPNAERVPTLLKQPKWSKVINPLMKFLSISPGYDERDVSIPVLVFFTIFFGMLVGDAGYGVIFLIVSGIVLAVKRDDKALRLPMALLMLLSCSAIVWGGLTANWFGMALLPGLPALADSPAKDRNVQLVCFSLALLQLSFAHVWRLLTGGMMWRNILTNIGWILILTGNFLLVLELLLFPGGIPKMGLYVCYGGGIALTAVGEVDWTDVGSVFGFPFSIVGSFVDVLSYIRLFAVGLAGYYLAACFNDMARPMFEEPKTFVVGLLILLFGHILNIALAAMSVLVHGVRLNTLEFSSHLGLRWAGFTFTPFRRKIENDSKEIAITQGDE